MKPQGRVVVGTQPGWRWTHRSLKLSLAAAMLVAMGIFISLLGNASSISREESISNLFTGPIQHFEIVIPQDGCNQLRRQPHSNIPARVRVGGQTFTNVALHLKGLGSFRPLEARPSFTLNFDKFQPGQRFAGLDKIHLNNSVQDETCLTEVVAAELYLRAGVPTGRATPALVSLNGLALGFYVLKEGLDRTFLRRHFRDPTGNLYETCWGCDVEDGMHRISGPGPDAQAGRELLVDRLEVPLSSENSEELSRYLDVPLFVTFAALQCLTDDWDGYLQRANNYRLYEDPSTRRLTFLPYGMDMILQRPASRVIPRMRGLVARSLFSRPEMRVQLEKRIAELTNTVFTAAVITNVINRTERRVMEAAYDLDPQSISYLRSSIDALRRRCLARLIHLATSQLTPAPFNPRGELPLTQWEPRVGTLLTPQQHGRTRSSNGHEILILRVAQPATLVQWRTLVTLAPGGYRFEARARCKGVLPYPGARSRGGGIRTMMGNVENQIEGTTDWTELTHSFRVTELNQVDLCLELRAHEGEVEFDASTLKLVKEP